jgi:predicted amidophosphoribosyltransferase
VLTGVHVLGDYWHLDRDEPTELGEIVAGAREQGRPDALQPLIRRLVEFVVTLDLPVHPMVAPVPPGPDRPAHPVPALADAVAFVLGATARPVLGRRHPTARLRDTPPEQRRTVVEAAGYHVTTDVTGRSVVLVDDVILTGTTIGHLAELLLDAGAARVDAVVAARTRLR